MYVVDRIEGNIVIIEINGKLIEVERDILPDVKEKDILYFENGKYIKNIKKTEDIKKDIRSKFNRLKR